MGTCQSHNNNVGAKHSVGTKETSAALQLETQHPILLQIEQLQSPRPFGRILDAGTGFSSLEWILSLTQREGFGVDGFTAITANPSMGKQLVEHAKTLLGTDEYEKVVASRPSSGVIVGNWMKHFNPEAESKSVLSIEEQYDTILVDYVVGAMDAFSPYYQDCLFESLAKHLKPGGRMYVTGLEPIPESEDSKANILSKIKNYRDACILLAGHRCYREYPLHWVLRNLGRTSELQVLEHAKFPLLHDADEILEQIKVARSELIHSHMARDNNGNRELVATLEGQSYLLEHETKQLMKSLPEHRIKSGFDYLVVAERKH